MPGLTFDHLVSTDGSPPDPFRGLHSIIDRVPPHAQFNVHENDGALLVFHKNGGDGPHHGAILVSPKDGNGAHRGILSSLIQYRREQSNKRQLVGFGSSLHGSADSENDLAAMVHDFLENGSCGSDFPESSDGENSLPNGPKLLETLQALKYKVTPCEKQLLTILTKLALSIKEIDLVCLKPGSECKEGCIRRLLVKHLRLSGYDAAICNSKWPNSGKVPGGEYEYIDVILEAIENSENRVIVDMDFQSEFALARATHSYTTAMKFLPVIFAGSSEKLEQILQVMAEAAKLSLSQNSMPLPPWRTLEYMQAKWLSPYDRTLVDTNGRVSRGPGNSQWKERTRTKQCVEQLRHLKKCVAGEMDKNITSRPVPFDRNRAMYLANTWRLGTGSPYLERSSFS